MPGLFLDTNIIIRYLTQDHPDHAARALRFLQQVETGELEVITTEAVIVEAVHVLSSRATYHLPREVVRDRLGEVIGLRGLRLPYKRVYLQALERWAAGSLDFVDALIVAHMQRAGIGAIASFDHDYDRIEGITRHEP